MVTFPRLSFSFSRCLPSYLAVVRELPFPGVYVLVIPLEGFFFPFFPSLQFLFLIHPSALFWWQQIFTGWKERRPALLP